MNLIIILMLILVYTLIGICVSAIVNGEGGPFVILLWPILIIGAVCLCIWDWITNS